MNKKTLIKLVKKEAKKLRELITKSERETLDFSWLSPRDQKNCIYGQITGNCFSPRAHRLINKCCERVVKTREGQHLYDGSINGKPKLNVNNNDRNVFSPIETFIWYKVNKTNGNTKALISYLKKETNQLKLKPF